MIWMSAWTAGSLFKTLERMATPCSANAIGYLRIAQFVISINLIQAALMTVFKTPPTCFKLRGAQIARLRAYVSYAAFALRDSTLREGPQFLLL